MPIAADMPASASRLDEDFVLRVQEFGFKLRALWLGGGNAKAVSNKNNNQGGG
jgi:hypothetical protein